MLICCLDQWTRIFDFFHCWIYLPEEQQIQIKKQWLSKTPAADVNTAFLSKPCEKDVTVGECDSILLLLPCEILATWAPTLYLQQLKQLKQAFDGTWSHMLVILKPKTKNLSSNVTQSQ